MSNKLDIDVNGVLTFNSTRTNTLSILNSLNGVKHWVTGEDGKTTEESIPITFGNYEKSVALSDIDSEMLASGNFNFIPRMVLSFVGMTKDASRTTNKYNKISKRVKNDKGEAQLNFAYNSVAYNFQYQLVLQARGLNETFQIVEQILPMFRPTYPISIKEFPLFDEMTETTLSITDPAFEVMDEFGPEDVNIVNVSFDLELKGNLYMPLQLTGPIENIIMMNHLWDTNNIEESQLASEYNFEVDTDTGKIKSETVEMIAPAKIK